MSGSTMMVTVVGWAATTPREVVGDGVPFTSFRLASTPRYFDARQRAWADGRTEWVTVKAFREVAFNVAASVRKGDPVLVHGRLQTQTWQSEQGPRTDLVLDAAALGHDLTRGTSRFARRLQVSGEQAAAGEQIGEVAQVEPAEPGTEAAPPPTQQDPWATSPVDVQEDARLTTP